MGLLENSHLFGKVQAWCSTCRSLVSEAGSALAAIGVALNPAAAFAVGLPIAEAFKRGAPGLTVSRTP